MLTYRVNLNTTENKSTKKHFTNSNQKPFTVLPFSPKNKRYFHYKHLLDKSNYLTYGLHKNLNSSPSSQFPNLISHEYLPLQYKNDEQYKLKLYKFIRPSKFSDSRTATCKYAEYSRNALHFDGNITKYENMFCVYRKHKRVNSCRKPYQSEQVLYDGKNVNRFRMFLDKDIGFNYKWQRPIHTSENNEDEDVETDNEQRELAERYCVMEIDDGIKMFNRNRKVARNYIRFHYGE
jgi:hypothetical protein